MSQLNNPFGGILYYKERTASTMHDARNNLSHGAIFLTDHQEQGQGRYPTRKWISYSEDLTFTLTLQQSQVLLKGPLPLLIALSLYRTMVTLCKKNQIESLRIKWPNDLLFDSQKLAGILCQSHDDYYLIGIGMNIHPRFEDQHHMTAITPLFPPIGLGDILESPVNKHILLEKVLHHIQLTLSDASWCESFDQVLFRPSNPITYEVGSTTITGYIEQISHEGSLGIRDALTNDLIYIYAGEVTRR
ncbi:biotin--[acetyl-CoA-carboxylase] ligase [Entomospira entomophila]|uniref:Biotin--[acetyl-CoA-carboxylase] ligase n=1 Tax=Entomospira entomophila TaxID=2719988 RepID=A0A968GCZ8_9SPIO|nr:biotin--[acetyl-CoA-carboxylase] ligase [Entomospira entomophilus]NIZ41186.1 biotin--[acetyl-CoA-carboxylase] ligase [Entomospira entomophilus]WDI35393.1 biotin--[acetyl-CoA-carboxylase] ligase [Entomospira entomophilus]